MILLCDSKADWPFTPAFTQVYVEDTQKILNKDKQNGGEIITELSDFYGGYKLSRFNPDYALEKL